MMGYITSVFGLSAAASEGRPAAIRMGAFPVKLGVALSGGDIYAAAHYGVLSALDELGIFPDVISCSGVSAFVCALYLKRYPAARAVQAIRKFLHCYDSMQGKSRYSGKPVKHRDKLERIAAKYIPDGCFTYNTQLCITCLDIAQGSPVVYTDSCGQIGKSFSCVQEFKMPQAIRASCADFMHIRPKSIAGCGVASSKILMPLPVFPLAVAGCDKILTVDTPSVETTVPYRKIAEHLAQGQRQLSTMRIDHTIDLGDFDTVCPPDIADIILSADLYVSGESAALYNALLF